MPLGRPLYDPTRDTRLAGLRRDVEMLKRRAIPDITAVGVAVETLFLDSLSAGGASSDTVLEDGQRYVITVQGTHSSWNEALGVGTPEADAMFPGSPSGRVSTEVGIDAETFFATPSDHVHPSGHYSFFQIDLGSGFAHIEPDDGQHTTPATGHLYRYTVTGQGAAATFWYQDNPGDYVGNYGKYKITIQSLDASSGSGTGTLVPPSGAERSFLRVLSGIAAWVSGIVEGDLSLSDVTTGNVSITKHGLAPKAPNDTTKALVGDGTFSYPTVDGGSA